MEGTRFPSRGVFVCVYLPVATPDPVVSRLKFKDETHYLQKEESMTLVALQRQSTATVCFQTVKDDAEWYRGK